MREVACAVRSCARWWSGYGAPHARAAHPDHPPAGHRRKAVPPRGCMCPRRTISSTGFHDHKAHGTVEEPAIELAAGEAVGFAYGPGCIGHGHLKHALGQVDADHGGICADCSPIASCRPPLRMFGRPATSGNPPLRHPMPRCFGSRRRHTDQDFNAIGGTALHPVQGARLGVIGLATAQICRRWVRMDLAACRA